MNILRSAQHQAYKHTGTADSLAAGRTCGLDRARRAPAEAPECHACGVWPMTSCRAPTISSVPCSAWHTRRRSSCVVNFSRPNYAPSRTLHVCGALNLPMLAVVHDKQPMNHSEPAWLISVMHSNGLTTECSSTICRLEVQGAAPGGST